MIMRLRPFAALLSLWMLASCTAPMTETAEPGARVPPAAAAPPTPAMRELVVLQPTLTQMDAAFWLFIADTLRKTDPFWPVFEDMGILLEPDWFNAAWIDMVAGGDEELVLSLNYGCGNSGCWTYILEAKGGEVRVVGSSTLQGNAFVAMRDAGQTYATISGYRHGLRWNGRFYEQFCTAAWYCGAP